MRTGSPSHPALVPAGAEFRGAVVFRGDLRLEGRVLGSVRGCGHLQILETASVCGPVQADSLRVEGELEGEIEVSGLVELAPKSRLVGSLRAASLRLEEGAELAAQPLAIGSLPIQQSSEPSSPPPT